MSDISLKVNGTTHTLDIDPSTPLLYILRNDLRLEGPRFGCGLSQCGAQLLIVGNRLQGDVRDDADFMTELQIFVRAEIVAGDLLENRVEHCGTEMGRTDAAVPTIRLRFAGVRRHKCERRGGRRCGNKHKRSRGNSKR